MRKWTNENQKPVNENYRSNYDTIFKKKEKEEKNDDRNEGQTKPDGIV